MKVIITSQGVSLDDAADPRFGRCAYFLVVDTDSGKVEAVPNPGAQAAGGAGPMAAQKISDLGAEVVITGNLGPSAAQSLGALNVKVYRFQGGSAAEALEAFKAGKLEQINGPTVEQHAGLK